MKLRELLEKTHSLNLDDEVFFQSPVGSVAIGHVAAKSGVIVFCHSNPTGEPRPYNLERLGNDVSDLRVAMLTKHNLEPKSLNVYVRGINGIDVHQVVGLSIDSSPRGGAPYVVIDYKVAAHVRLEKK